MDKDKDYTVILPTLDESGHIKNLILEITEIFKLNKINYTILVVDDCSNDGTIDIVQELKKKNSNISIIIRNNKKKSLVDSLNDGIKNSNSEFVIWLDADYSHPPKYITEFINYNIKYDYDLIVFSRFLKKSVRYFDGSSLKSKSIEKMSNFLNKVCQLLLFKDLTDYTSGYICIKKSFFQDKYLNGYYGDYFIELLNRAKLRNASIKELPYTERDRETGYSKTTSNKLSLVVKCYFYAFRILICFLKKIFKIK